METLTFPEGTNMSIGSGWDATARVLKADFAPNPVSRARDGINSIDREYTISISMLSDAEAKAIDDFLTARAGAEAFFWSPRNEGEARRWTCEKWGIRHIETGFHSLTATFTEIFAP